MQDVGHPHLLCIRVQFVQILFRVGCVQLQRRKECFGSQFVAAADDVTDRALQIVGRDIISGRGFQRGLSQLEQLRLDVIHFALGLDRC